MIYHSEAAQLKKHLHQQSRPSPSPSPSVSSQSTTATSSSSGVPSPPPVASFAGRHNSFLLLLIVYIYIRGRRSSFASASAPSPQQKSFSSSMEQVDENQKQKKNRVCWKDINVVKTFLEACIHEVVQNGREGSSLKSFSWKKVGEILKNNHNFIADQRQLKNRYDYMKAKYRAWSKLKNKTGNVYDPSNNTFNMSEEEWSAEIKANKYVATLKSAPLPFPDLCTQLFDGIVPTGVESLGSTSMSPMPLQIIEDIPEDNEIPTSTPNCSSHFEQQRPEKKAKLSKDSMNSEIDGKLLKAMSLIIENGKNSGVPSITECREKLLRLGWGKQNILHKWANVILSEGPSYRENWMSLDDDECEDYIRILGHKLGLCV